MLKKKLTRALMESLRRKIYVNNIASENAQPVKEKLIIVLNVQGFTRKMKKENAPIGFMIKLGKGS